MPDDRVASKEFAVTMLEKLDKHNKFLMKVMFSDKATVHILGKVSKQNVYIWVSEQPHTTLEHIRDSLKVSEWPAA
jgi:hypothetical protein